MTHKAPAFQFYAKDWFVSTAAMSLLERGAYITLLAWSWDNGPLPAGEARRAQLLGLSRSAFGRLWPHLAGKWVETAGGYVNRRLERQRAILARFTTGQAAYGKAGASKRWKSQRHGPPIVPTMGSPIGSPSPEDGHPMVETMGSPSPKDGSSVFDLQSSSSDQDQDQEQCADAHASRSRVLVKLAHTVLDDISADADVPPISELTHRLGDTATRHRIAYATARELTKAMDSAVAQRQRRAS